jgi:CheY-like chemotaxis protein
MPSSRRRVLVVDDDPKVVSAVSRLLALGHNVVGTVADGSEVLEAVQRLRPDVVVLDLHLPNLDGLSACRQITQGDTEMRVVVFTASEDPNARQRAFEAGASAFVHKFASVEELLLAVQGADGTRE